METSKKKQCYKEATISLEEDIPSSSTEDILKHLNMQKYYREQAITVEENVFSQVHENIIYYFVKRLLDIILSIVGLIIGIPLVIIFSILIRLETPGSPLYFQERVGKGGKTFTLYKLRSMVKDAEKHGARWAQENDPRVTKVGEFIRKTRIDEIPQIFNILFGQMTIVGPRPERPNFTYQFNEEIPGFINRLQVKPGLTGWAQVTGGYDMTPREKWEADMYYIENRSIWMDLKIILKTVRIVFTGDGAR